MFYVFLDKFLKYISIIGIVNYIEFKRKQQNDGHDRCKASHEFQKC